MTKRKQRALLRAIMRNMSTYLIAQSDRWPEIWDGHELRELIYMQAERERTTLMRESRSYRRRDCQNYAIINRLY